MRIVYTPAGRALEYSDLAANLYRGCGHACDYCYAPSVLRLTKDAFYTAKLRNKVLENLTRDAKELQEAGNTKSILLCFTCDPYQPIDEHFMLTRGAIRILHDHEQPVTILTKGGKRSTRDFDLLAEHPDLSTYAATLVFTDDAMRQIHEPHAAPMQERIDALELANRRGIETWVSLEPVFYPDQTLKLIEMTHPFVDHYKVGKLNHAASAASVDWATFGNDAVALLERLGKDYYIKLDLREAMEKVV